jgi:demethylmenaquinone methyltransferase/2-methoxy-6-polyprenyl-1,4-benzoquinol methylase
MSSRHSNLIAYYNERAHEYDDLYAGTMPSIDAPDLYTIDVRNITKLVSRFAARNVIDIGCGTGYWLSFYGANASHILLVDESANMLRECRIRAHRLGIAEKCDFVRGNFFNAKLAGGHYDGAIIGFVLSHVDADDEKVLFSRLDTLLTQDAQILIIDSTWSAFRARSRNKDGMQKRVLNDGRVFSIYKRYFTLDELFALMHRHGFDVTVSYTGDVFCAAIGLRHA